jgi:formylglycine-generating enzyme required for sulfatase activity
VAYEDWLDDGYAVHAPVGSFRSNGFGLHDVIGNVWEWCRDEFGDYGVPVHPGDGERPVANPRNRLIRGGSFLDTAGGARSANRGLAAPELRYYSLGVRPATGLTPP